MKNLTKYLANPSCVIFRFVCIAAVLALNACSLTADKTEQVAANEQTTTENIAADSPKQSAESSESQLSETTETPAAQPTKSVKTPEQLALEQAAAQQQAEKLALQQAKIEDLYKQALDAMRAQDYKQAESLFEQILQLNPKQTGVLINCAIIAKKQQNLAKAQQLLEQVITEQSNHAHAQHLLATVYQQQGIFDKAEQAYKDALKVEPEFKQAMLNYAVLLDLYRGDWQGAKQYYQAFLQLEPDNRQVKMWLAAVEQKAAAAQQGQG